MPLDDDDPDKWQGGEHTEVKHRILRKYLTTWTRIVSSTNSELHYFDGFAGRAEYDGESGGSPLIAIDVANRNAERFDKFHCTFNELNEGNYEHLSKEVHEKAKECENIGKVRAELKNEEFEDVALPVLKHERYRNIPSLVFVDPFGYEGTPFEVISDIMNLRESGDEVFFTFMVDTIRRFLGDEEKESTITRIFGTDDWKYIRDINSRERQEEEILKVYVNQLEESAGVEHVFPFQMKHPDKDVTLYYLIHATNHFKGFKVMKDVMFKEGADDLFAYLGSDHYGYEENQTTLFESTASEDTRITELEDRLIDWYEDTTITYGKIIEETYSKTDLVEPQYRTALSNLESEDKIQVDRGDSSRGFNEDYEIHFKPENQRLTDFG